MNPIRYYLLPLLLLAACAAEPPPPAPTPVTTDASWYEKAAQAGKQVYRIDAGQSLITVVVRRGGPLARFGHDHVVASRSITGFVAPDAGRADFHFRLDQMTVDEAALRTEAGLDTQPDTDAIGGTRNNMLNRVLDAGRFPVVLLHAERINGVSDKLRLTVTLHGVEQTVDVPVKIERSKTSITASGELRLLQTAFGIAPMSVMGGAMVVQDPMEMKFRIVAAAQR
jgi:hypothetical protein